MNYKKKLRQSIRKAHLAVDGLIGKMFSNQKSLGMLSRKPHQPITTDKLADFSFSKSRQFSNMVPLSIHKKQSPATCDLKVYQDSFIHTFILDNITPGAKILEIGGGESRVIKECQNEYEFWNLDKLEGSGYGPTELMKEFGFKLVRNYIGSFSKDLPNGYFDLVYSISTIEHFSKKPEDLVAIFDDIQRLLKPGGISIHCIDALKCEDHYFVHPFVEYAYQQNVPLYPLVSFEELQACQDLWTLPPFAFYTRWYHLVKKPMKEFGYPFSINMIWRKPAN